MKLGDLTNTLSLNVLSGRENMQNAVTGGYVSDMLSDVLANSSEGNLWITLQTHVNIVAVANLKNLAGILIVNNRQPEESTLKKAAEEKITVMTTELSAFDAAGIIYRLLGERG
jgi:predicted transcriptional regulator